MNLHIYNTLSNKKEQFLPHTENKVSMYVCGPTVYSAPHIGNARAALVGDLFYRLLQKLYEEVIYIRNLTDVDDKIIQESEKTGIPINVITQNITEIYQNEMSKLNMLVPTFEPKVTDNINTTTEWKKLAFDEIQRLDENEKTLIQNDQNLQEQIDKIEDYLIENFSGKPR